MDTLDCVCIHKTRALAQLCGDADFEQQGDGRVPEKPLGLSKEVDYGRPALSSQPASATHCQGSFAASYYLTKHRVPSQHCLIFPLDPSPTISQRGKLRAVPWFPKVVPVGHSASRFIRTRHHERFWMWEVIQSTAFLGARTQRRASVFKDRNL